MSSHTLSNSSRNSSRSKRSSTSESFKKDDCRGTFLNVNLLFLFFFGLFIYVSVKTPMFPGIGETKKALLDKLVNTLSSDKKKLL